MITNRGMALIEIIIGSTIISVGIFAAVTSFNTYVNYALANQKNIQASYLLEEGLEVVGYFRDKGWTANISRLSTTTTYYLTWDSNDWATTTTAQYVDGEFLRSITITDVKRDSNDDVAVLGTYDPNTKNITATVSYFQGHATTTKSISTLISNLYAN
jgi:Tfp pilus assembly protein PilE